MSEIQVRAFRNPDPPELVRLWNSAYQARGVAAPISCDIFDRTVLSLVYFDPAGLLVAKEGEEFVGFLHVGFCVNEEKTALDHSQAVICALVVAPDRSFDEVGSKLLDAANEYARQKGATVLFAGPSPGRDPFYMGIYGGSRLSGFLESQPQLGEFFVAKEFAPEEQHLIFQKDLLQTRDPISFRISTLRRKLEFRFVAIDEAPNWWWSARFGWMDIIRLEMLPKNGLEPIGSVSVAGLDFFVASWNHRAVGMLDVEIDESLRQQGYGRTLLLEVGRRLKDEMVTLLEIHTPATNEALIKLISGSGFTQVDTGIVYRKSL